MRWFKVFCGSLHFISFHRFALPFESSSPKLIRFTFGGVIATMYPFLHHLSMLLTEDSVSLSLQSLATSLYLILLPAHVPPEHYSDHSLMFQSYERSMARAVEFLLSFPKEGTWLLYFPTNILVSWIIRLQPLDHLKDKYSPNGFVWVGPRSNRSLKKVTSISPLPHFFSLLLLFSFVTFILPPTWAYHHQWFCLHLTIFDDGSWVSFPYAVSCSSFSHHDSL